MKRVRFALFGALLALGALSTPSGAEPGGNSAAAHACQQGGYKSLIGTNGGFKNVGQCVSYAARGGTFVTPAPGQFLIPAGQTATLSNAEWTLRPCDVLTYGYEVDFGADVPIANKPPGCFNASLPGAVVGPFPTAVILRIFLNDTGVPGDTCNYTFYSDGPHALVVGTNPYDVSIRDSFFCESDPDDPLTPGAPGHGNLRVLVTIA